MQHSLLPHPDTVAMLKRDLALDIASTYAPSIDLGGDIWGLEPLGPNRLRLYSADFTGHGVGAALNTFRLHTFIASGVAHAEDPAEWLAEINEFLCSILEVGQFATIFSAVIDFAAGGIAYSPASCPAPLLRIGSTAPFTLLSGTYEAGTTVEMFFQQVGTTEYDTLQVTGNLDKAFSIGYTITVDAARNLDGILTSVGANLGSAVPIGTPTLTVSSRSFATFSVTKSSGAAFGPLAGVRTLSIVDALDPQGGAANSLTNSFTETVPEPSAVVLVGACLTIMGLKRWYRTR